MQSCVSPAVAVAPTAQQVSKIFAVLIAVSIKVGRAELAAMQWGEIGSPVAWIPGMDTGATRLSRFSYWLGVGEDDHAGGLCIRLDLNGAPGLLWGIDRSGVLRGGGYGGWAKAKQGQNAGGIWHESSL